jgi:cation diffusion facilitator family transporter
MSESHSHDLSRWQHPHDFVGAQAREAERRTWWVVGITVAMMVGEIVAGMAWHSMALLADGWHMGTHAVAIGVAGVSYWLARRWASDARFSLGPWKVEVLGAYSSAVLLAAVALSIGVESVQRFFAPAAIAYDESLAVAVLGLAVNLLCAWLLEGAHAHGHAHEPHHAAHEHDHEHEHEHEVHAHHHHGDINLRAAYVHVLADAATSVLAIAALLAGRFYGWAWLDPLVGLVGALVIAQWAYALIRTSATILLDREMDHPLAVLVRQRLQSDGDATVADLHLTRVGGDRFAVHATVVAGAPLSADSYRDRVADLDKVAHVTIEVNRCEDCGRRG